MKNWKYENTNMPGWFYVPGVCGEIEGEDKARLIAAAPEMLAALKKILAVKRTIDLNLFDIEEIHSIANAALEAAEREK